MKSSEENQSATVVAVCRSDNKGERKKNIGKSLLIQEHGLESDAHAGDWHRQVSLLAMESIAKMQDMGLDVHPGDFAENITTAGIDLLSLKEGSRIKIGAEVLLEITQLGKVCHNRCAIYYLAGDCVMPKEGIFARVLQGGNVEVTDVIEVISY